MRIAVVASPVTSLRPAQPGGAQAVLCDLAFGLTRRGHDVVLYCAEGSEVDGVKVVMVPRPRDSEAALVMPLGPPAPPAPGVEEAIAAMFNAVASRNPDAVSQHAFDAAAFEASRGLPVLHTLHLPPIVPAVVRAAANTSSDRLATVSHSCLLGWRSAGIEVGRLIRNGVPDIDVASADPSRVALVAGRISPEKGIDHALAAARIAGLPVRVAGALYDPGYDVDLDGADRLGELTRLDLRRVMAESAVTVCAVRWEEPFGLVAAEAQMAGCPVAGYRRGAMPEVVEEGVTGFLAEPDDIEALAAAIDACAGLDRDRVRASARRRLGLDGMLDAYEKALREIAS
jgi:glycosyltransferase involved in cell wall biosynthesis